MATYKINDRVFNTLTRTITEGTDDVRKLSQSEVYLLAYLIENKGRIIKKNDLMAVGWPRKVVVVNSLTVAISNLRKALEDPDIINSNKGVGYTFSTQAAIEHSASDEVEDEVITKDYAIPQKNNKKCWILDTFFYISILIFVATGLFATNWALNYVPGE